MTLRFLSFFLMLGLAFPTYPMAQEPSQTSNSEKIKTSIQELNTQETQEVGDLLCQKLKDKAYYDTMPDLAENKYLIQGKDGWIFETSNDLKEDYSFHPDVIRLMKRIQDRFAMQGITLSVLQIPSRGTLDASMFPENIEDYGTFDPVLAMESYRSLAEYKDKFNLNLVTVDGLKQGDTGFYMKRDIHWSPDGAEKAAKAMAAHIKSFPVYKKLRKNKFETTLVETIKGRQVYAEIIKNHCGTDVPLEENKIYQTVKVGEGLDQKALFEDTPPEVVVVGTSYSKQEETPTNFSGFLEENLSTDVLNLAIPGGGVETSIIKFLEDRNSLATAPKIVIWEIPGHYRMSSIRYVPVMEQVLGLIERDCTTITEKGSVRLGLKSTPLLSKLETKTDLGQAYTTTFTFDQPTNGNFTFIYRTVGENGQVYRYKRSFARREAAGEGKEYVTLIDIKPTEKLAGITVRGKKSLNGITVQGTLCPVAPLQVISSNQPDKLADINPPPGDSTTP